jgi:hypothetical protein
MPDPVLAIDQQIETRVDEIGKVCG